MKAKCAVNPGSSHPRRLSLKPLGPKRAVLELAESDDPISRAEWFKANEPSANPPDSLASPADYSAQGAGARKREEWELQKCTVEYLKRDPFWFPRPNTTWRDYVVEVASKTAREGLQHLQRLVAKGDGQALAAFASETIDMVKSLNSFVLSESHHPKLIPFARKCLAWPALKARRNVFSDDHDELIRVLQVGKGTIFGKDSHARFNPTGRFGKVTMELIERIEHVRSTAQSFYFGTPPSWAGEAIKLPAFNEASKLKWWAVAERILDEDYANPKQAETYNELVTAQTHQHRKKSVFIDKIRGEFDTLADMHRVKKKPGS